MASPVLIADYDPDWPVLYERQRDAVARALGPLLARVEHIGSTAVPGLAAKPIVDIMVGLVEDADLNACVRPLQGVGYQYIPQYEDVMPFRRFFRMPPRPHPSAYNLHAVRVGSPFWDHHLAFRDYLRAHPETARAYAEHKRRLAPGFTDVNEYARAKTRFIETVLAAAGPLRES